VKKILGLLGWLGVGLVLAAVAIRFLKPEWQPWSQRLALAGLVVTAIYALSQWRDIGRSFGGRNVRYGSMAAGGVVLFLGLLAGVNYLGVRHHKIWDLTANQQFSLSDQTTKILKDLKKPVVIRAFYDSSPDAGNQKQELTDRLGAYAYQSSQVTVEYVDAVKDPVQAKQADVQTVPTTLFVYDGRTERTTGRAEQDFTNALKKVLEGKTKKLYFSQGHGEHDMASSDQRAGYSGAVTALKQDNVESAKLVLAQEGKVPDDATLLVIGGPKFDYAAQEIDALKTYLARGGKLLLMLDPPEKLESPPLTNLIALAKEWGIDVGTNIVIDVSGVGRQIGAGPVVPIAMPSTPTHPITERMEVAGVFPLTRSVTPIEGGTNGKIAQKVMETSPRSWAETNLKDLFASKQPELDPKTDKPGPVTIVSAVASAAPDAPPPASADLPKPEARMVVVGDSDFASNAALNAQGNKDLFLNMISWLAQQENLIAIRPKEAGDSRLQLTADQGDRIKWLTIWIIPFLLFGVGFRAWWRRRK
jgi:ABC-type uncharacterized transport system involved in gliding motility auxiliary subunit